jgi:hypothetical protein
VIKLFFVIAIYCDMQVKIVEWNSLDKNLNYNRTIDIDLESMEEELNIEHAGNEYLVELIWSYSLIKGAKSTNPYMFPDDPDELMLEDLEINIVSENFELFPDAFRKGLSLELARYLPCDTWSKRLL